MPSSPSLTSTLQESTGVTAEELARPEAPVELEPLPPLLPPEGVVAARVRDVASRVRSTASGRVDVAGVRGSASAAVAAAIARASRRVVLVTADVDAARRAAEDVAFLVRGAIDDDAEDTGAGEVLVFAASEASPYADVNPDRRAAMSRMATLFHLAHERPWSVLVVPASALARKVVPRTELAKRADRLVAEQELDRDGLVRSLAEAGYLRVPVVEDPGGFAVRGALIDVWPPSSENPVRVELYGELVLSMKPFDPIEQTTPEGRARARGAVAVPGARGDPRQARRGSRPRATHPAGGGDGLADDQDAGARRRRRAGAGVLRRGGVPPRVLRGARSAPRLRSGRRGRRRGRPAVDDAGRARRAGPKQGRLRAEGGLRAHVPAGGVLP